MCHSHTRGSKFPDSHLAFLLIFSSIVPNDLDIFVTAELDSSLLGSSSVVFDGLLLFFSYC